MKLCRFTSPTHPYPRVGVQIDGPDILDLSTAGVTCLESLLEEPDVVAAVKRLVDAGGLRSVTADGVRLRAPVARQEVWAAGVTYLRSKTARMEESDFSATAYDRVYDAPRPEIFFKASPGKVVGPGEAVGIRADARWNVPEPELALVFNSRAEVVGYTAGNDMSSRDIEGENLLYLPQAKVYSRSCALGPFITIGVDESAVRQWTISVRIERAGTAVFEGSVAVGNIKRPFAELGEYLFRSQTFRRGAILLTGTGVVPPNEFTLAAGDRVTIDISGVGTLTNDVVVV